MVSPPSAAAAAGTWRLGLEGKTLNRSTGFLQNRLDLEIGLKIRDVGFEETPLMAAEVENRWRSEGLDRTDGRRFGEKRGKGEVGLVESGVGGRLMREESILMAV